jgi:hypothetical protein
MQKGKINKEHYVLDHHQTQIYFPQSVKKIDVMDNYRKKIARTLFSI